MNVFDQWGHMEVKFPPDPVPEVAVEELQRSMLRSLMKLHPEVASEESMNATVTKALRKQHRQYQTEALAKRRNLADYLQSPNGCNRLLMAQTMNEQTMMIIRTEAKAKAIEELADALGIELGVEG